MKRSTKLVFGLALAVLIVCVVWMAVQRNRGGMGAAVYMPSPTPTAMALQTAVEGPEYTDRLTGTPVLGPQLTGTPDPEYDMLGYTDPEDDDYGMI